VPVADCRIIDLQTISDPRGNLSVVEGGRSIPFDIKRVFYLYDVPGGATRAGHANKKLQEVLIAVSGSFDVEVDDGVEKKVFSLNRSYRGLYLPGMVWRELNNFSSGAVCLVLASEHYDAEDYFRHRAGYYLAVARS
jgi:hypothetical protein